MTPATNRVLSSREAAVFLRVHINTLWKLVANGEIPGRKVGANWKFLESELVRYLGGEVTSPAGVASTSERSQ